MSATRPSVAIVLLNWNGASDTIVCLRSVAALAYGNRRVIVVDNGSTDDSVARLREAFPDQALMETGANLGFGGGNNVGIRRALEQGAEYIWLLNTDTRVEPGALAAMVELAERRPDVGAVGSVLYDMERPDRVQVWGGAEVSLWLGFFREHRAPVAERRLHWLAAASLLYRRSAAEQVGLFDEGFFLTWEDADLGVRIRRAGWRLAVAEGSQVWHKRSASTGGRTAAADRYFYPGAARFFKKHAPVPFLPFLAWIAAGTARRALRGEWRRAAIVLRALRHLRTGATGGSKSRPEP